jgi:hypothetical protein
MNAAICCLPASPLLNIQGILLFYLVGFLLFLSSRHLFDISILKPFCHLLDNSCLNPLRNNDTLIYYLMKGKIRFDLSKQDHDR